MKILTVCSGLDFINFTRRATIEAIHKINPELDILLFNSVMNIRKKKNISNNINFYHYHFWIVEKLRKFKIFPFIEHILRSVKWRDFFKLYEVIFFIDPNQYYLLPYLNKNQKLIYLLRDPSVLMDPNNFRKEIQIIKRADLILGISNNLCGFYFKKYYGFIPDNVKLWPNTVDLSLWNYTKWKPFIKQKARPLVGLAGNINYVIDIELLLYIAKQLPEYDFEIAGKLDLKNKELIIWEELLNLQNVRYLGFINYNEFPKTAINWDIGLVAAKPGQEYSQYLNNNKQYQYMALGKPFVSYRHDADYKEFDEVICIAESPEDYIDKIHLAIKKSVDPEIIEKAFEIAFNQSADIRAKSFINYITKL